MQVAGKGSFAHPLLDEIADRPMLVADAKSLPLGAFCWRVREESADRKGPWSDAICFDVSDHARLRAPQLYDPTISRGKKTR